jgi:2-dehydro-3-deoxyglucarate aldolase
VKRLLDAGADGIIVPMVSSLAEVERLAGWFRYPPEGHRSFGVARAQRYGAAFDEYAASWNAVGCLIIQIESMAGVDEAETMLRHDAVDGVMVGPYDLSGSLGVPGDLNHPRVEAACERILHACAAAGKTCGTHLIEPDLDRIGRALAAGYTLVVLASDVFILGKWSERMSGVLADVRVAL